MTVSSMAKPIFTQSNLVTRKVETSDPKELDEKHLKEELGYDDALNYKDPEFKKKFRAATKVSRVELVTGIDGD